MTTFVIALKNTTADNAFDCLRRMNGKVVAGEMVFVGPCQRYEMACDIRLSRDEADEYIRSFFAGRIAAFRASGAGEVNGPVLCIKTSKTDFVFFGRHN